ncbi:hypothetical protein [uncultured Winogradskyella sp.]|uniref:hypothetical protein n=1 Tax=uncultured Winogradskyella sp. TaxID=395353 RepID=UPI002612FA14|nr:hypothetical protein [uncultured Winogradskyella sp.]
MVLTPKRIYKIGLFFLAVFSLSALLLWLFEKRFDKVLWENNSTQRYQMVDDLIESQILLGKTKDEVIVLLGQPYSSSNVEKDIFIYRLGDQPSFFNSRKEHLLILFINQKVDEATLALE